MLFGSQRFTEEAERNREVIQVFLCDLATLRWVFLFSVFLREFSVKLCVTTIPRSRAAPALSRSSATPITLTTAGRTWRGTRPASFGVGRGTAAIPPGFAVAATASGTIPGAGLAAGAFVASEPSPRRSLSFVRCSLSIVHRQLSIARHSSPITEYAIRHTYYVWRIP
jgi:hypothetical protein